MGDDLHAVSRVAEFRVHDEVFTAFGGESQVYSGVPWDWDGREHHCLE